MISLLLLFFGAAPILAQHLSVKERAADKHFEVAAYHKAIKRYAKVAEKDPTNHRVKLKLAESYFHANQPIEAEQWYAQVINKKHLVKSGHRLHYAQILQSNGKFEESLRWAKKYLNTNPRSEVAQNLVYSLQNINGYYADSAKYLVTTVNINTPAAEFAPSYYGDGIVFSSSRSSKLNLQKNYSWDNSKYLDLYQTQQILGKDVFEEPQKLPGKVNSGLHEGSATFLNEDSRIIFTRNQREGNADKLSLLTAIQTSDSDKWQRLESLPFNSKNYSVGHPSMDREGTTLYFVSDMPGGQGGTDIYKVVYVRGKWGIPQNLGPEVNTPGNELFPFIGDDEMLYFSSNGHPGMGGLDIYKADLKASNPSVKNMGYPINSTLDDFGLITRGGTGYFSSNRSGNDDIYGFEVNQADLLVQLPSELKYDDQAEVLLSYQGAVIDRKPLDARGLANFEIAKGLDYQITSSISGYKPVDLTVNTDQEQFEVAVDLQPNRPPQSEGHMLVINGSKKAQSYILSGSQVIEVKDQQTEAEANWLAQLLEEQNIILTDTTTLNPIHYKFDRSDIDLQYQPELEQLASLMLKFGNLQFELGSHTDSRGPAAYNLRLSQQRAQAAMDYLVQRGVAQQRLVAMGFGEEQLINNCVDNHPCNNAKHLVNRRTEFRLIYMDQNQVVSNY